MNPAAADLYGAPEREPTFEFKRPEWQAQASCHPDVIPDEAWQPWGDYPTDLFYPERGSPQRRIQAIQSVCGTCPVQAECFEHGVLHEENGWWGGKPPAELHAERKRRGIRNQTPEIDARYKKVIGTFDPPQHGTEQRYQQHWREGEKPCEVCAEAHRILRAPEAGQKYRDLSPQEKEIRRQQRRVRAEQLRIERRQRGA